MDFLPLFLSSDDVLLCFEVDTIFEFFIKTLNAAEYIESDVQNIEASRTDDPIIYYV